MNKHRFINGHLSFALICCVLLGACTSDTAQQGAQTDRLPPCSADGSGFELRPFRQWKQYYHDKVNKAVEAHLKTIEETTSNPLQCTAESYSELVPASDELKEIAASLPGYYKDLSKLGSVTETDIGPVLLEFLRVYECSMRERQRLLPILVPKEATGAIYVGEYLESEGADIKIINEELAIARPTLERTLTIIGGYDRLRPLTLDIECIKRTSLDLRNVLGLAADASSCLPRVWDTHGSLRDLP